MFICTYVLDWYMGRIVVEMDNELEKQFRDEIAKRLGMKKGNIKSAIEDAVKLWMKQEA